MQFRQVIRVRILVRWVGASLPLIQIGEAVGIGILIENIRVLDRQVVFFEPVVRHRRMHLRVLQRRRPTVCADEMFLRNEKPRARAGFPLCRMLELLRGASEFDRDGRRRGGFCRRRLLGDQAVAELDGVPPNENRGKKKKSRSRDERDAIVMCLNPVHGLRHGQLLTTNEHEWTRIYKAILCHSSFECLKLRTTPTRRLVIRR